MKINKFLLNYFLFVTFLAAYKKNYREWWKFAINCILEEDIKKRNREWTWEHIKEHRQLCNTYAEVIDTYILIYAYITISKKKKKLPTSSPIEFQRKGAI